MKLSVFEDNIFSLLKQVGFVSGNVLDFEIEQIHPDGSQRRFFRINPRQAGSYVAVLPPEDSKNGRDSSSENAFAAS